MHRVWKISLESFLKCTLTALHIPLSVFLKDWKTCLYTNLILYIKFDYSFFACFKDIFTHGYIRSDQLPKTTFLDSGDFKISTNRNLLCASVHRVFV